MLKSELARPPKKKTSLKEEEGLKTITLFFVSKTYSIDCEDAPPSPRSLFLKGEREKEERGHSFDELLACCSAWPSLRWNGCLTSAVLTPRHTSPRNSITCTRGLVCICRRIGRPKVRIESGTQPHTRYAHYRLSYTS